VTVVRALYDRFRQIIHEFAKFGVIGIVGLLITNIGYVVFEKLGLGPVAATTVATIIATAVTYVGNRYWSFSHRERTSVAREGVIFFLLNGIGLLIQDAAVGFNAYVLGLKGDKLAEFLALNIGIGLATLFRFWSYRKFVWAAKAGEGGVTATADGTAGPDQPTDARRDEGFPAAGTAPGSIDHANGHDVGARPSGDSSYSRS
jgi:putative flippase GtrA